MTTMTLVLITPTAPHSLHAHSSLLCGSSRSSPSPFRSSRSKHAHRADGATVCAACERTDEVSQLPNHSGSMARVPGPVGAMTCAPPDWRPGLGAKSVRVSGGWSRGKRVLKPAWRKLTDFSHGSLCPAQLPARRWPTQSSSNKPP